jgi:hypothetical protein
VGEESGSGHALVDRRRGLRGGLDLPAEPGGVAAAAGVGVAEVAEPLELCGDVLDLPALLGSDLRAGLAAAQAGTFSLGKVVLDDGDGKVLEIGDAAASAAGLGADASGVGGIGVLGKRNVLDGPGLERGREVEQQLAEVGPERSRSARGP